MKNNSWRTIFALSACMALQMTSFVIILPLFARRFTELGAGVEALGISSMVYALASTLAAPVMGALADRFGRKPLLLVSLAAFAAAFCGFLLAQTATAIIVIRGLAGVSTAGLMPVVTGLAADIAPKDRQAQWIGFVGAGASFGWIAGPVAGGLIYDRWGYNPAVAVSICLAVLALLTALLAIPNSHRPPVISIALSKEQAVPSPQTNGILRNIRGSLPHSLPAFFILLCIFFAVLFAWSFIEPRFMFYAYNDLGWSSSMLGLAMSTYGIAMMAGELGFGHLSDRVGRKPVILLGLVFFSAQFIGLAFFNNYFLIAASFVCAGFGNALYDPALNASILEISPAEHRSRILGIKSMVGSVGSIVGPALAALLNGSVDAHGIFLGAVAIVILSTLTGLAYPAISRHTAETLAPHAVATDHPANPMNATGI